MRVYTYYESIKFDNQLELIKLWKSSWERMGWDAYILNIEHAKQNPYAGEMSEEMSKIFKELKGEDITAYGMSCYNRWLAYANEKIDEPFIVCDYDIINKDLEPFQLMDKLHLMDDACPCIASGNSQQFDDLCRMIVDLSNEDLNRIKEYDMHWYHDQEFFIYNFNIPFVSEEELIARKEKYNIELTRDRSFVAEPFSYNEDQECKAFHVSHSNIHHIVENNKFDKFANKSLDEIRIEVVKDILKK
jgi:hypothetical protein